MPQDDSLATYAPKVDREATRIDWSATAIDVSRAIRAYDPAPGAFTQLSGKDLKLFGPRVVESGNGVAGTLLSSDPNLVIACGRGAIEVAEVQPAGKARMRAQEWIRGRGAMPGDVLGA
jgi:methionyl-tRNA formyltransferase